MCYESFWRRRQAKNPYVPVTQVLYILCSAAVSMLRQSFFFFLLILTVIRTVQAIWRACLSLQICFHYCAYGWHISKAIKTRRVEENVLFPFELATVWVTRQLKGTKTNARGKTADNLLTTTCFSGWTRNYLLQLCTWHSKESIVHH